MGEIPSLFNQKLVFVVEFTGCAWAAFYSVEFWSLYILALSEFPFIIGWLKFRTKLYMLHPFAFLFIPKVVFDYLKSEFVVRKSPVAVINISSVADLSFTLPWFNLYSIFIAVLLVRYSEGCSLETQINKLEVLTTLFFGRAITVAINEFHGSTLSVI